MARVKVFKSGNSQAVRLPKEFHIQARELHILRQDRDLILRPIRKSWKDYFDHGRRFSEDFPEHIEDISPEEGASW